MLRIFRRTPRPDSADSETERIPSWIEIRKALETLQIDAVHLNSGNSVTVYFLRNAWVQVRHLGETAHPGTELEVRLFLPGHYKKKSLISIVSQGVEHRFPFNTSSRKDEVLVSRGRLTFSIQQPAD